MPSGCCPPQPFPNPASTAGASVQRIGRRRNRSRFARDSRRNRQNRRSAGKSKPVTRCRAAVSWLLDGPGYCPAGSRPDSIYSPAQGSISACDPDRSHSSAARCVSRWLHGDRERLSQCQCSAMLSAPTSRTRGCSCVVRRSPCRAQPAGHPPAGCAAGRHRGRPGCPTL